MTPLSFKKIGIFVGVFLAVWLLLRYALPLGLPFALGALLALGAEPLVRFLSGKLHLPRWIAAGLGVSAAIFLIFGAVFLLLSLVVREVGQLAQAMPDVENAVQQGMLALQDFLLALAARTPDGIRPLLQRTVLDLFSSGTALISRLAGRIPALLSGLLSHIPGSFLGLGTGLLSGFMISARFPRLKRWLKSKVPASYHEKYKPALQRIRTNLAGWLKAQCKLAGLTFCIICGGLLLLGVRYAPLIAAGVALVDAIPILGTGTVLLPWTLVCLLQGNSLQALGLAGIYVAAVLTRTVLEPRLVGKQLGLDPLITLVCLYAGYRLWGIGGMLLAPLLAVTALQISAKGQLS